VKLEEGQAPGWKSYWLVLTVLHIVGIYPSAVYSLLIPLGHGEHIILRNYSILSRFADSVPRTCRE
jgi:hypothetical protein